jgi:hypothetical protein
MDRPTTIALLLAIPLILLGLASAVWQIRGMKLLNARKHVPSDEGDYLRRRHRRRLLNGILMVVIGVMIGGAYLSGMEARADRVRPIVAAEGADGNPEAPAVKAPPTPEEKRFFRFWAMYWIIVLVLAFGLIFVASSDAWATRRYAMKMFRELRDEHRARLARDLAVFKQQKTDRFGNRLRGGDDA